MDFENEINNLKKRVDYQEKIHPDITYTKAGITHGIFSMMPYLLITVAVSSLIVLAVVHSKEVKIKSQ